MKKMEILSMVLFSSALASTGFAAADNTDCCGGLFRVFIFFGALIVVAQLIPAILVIIGFIRGFPIKHHKLEGGMKDEKRGV